MNYDENYGENYDPNQDDRYDEDYDKNYNDKKVENCKRIMMKITIIIFMRIMIKLG